MTADRAHDEPAGEADIELGAVVRAKQLRFKRTPEAEVSFRGDPEPESDSHTERENLPDEVKPGVTYQDVRVRWQAGARLRSRPPERSK
jgi:hypothetical protein